MINVKRRILFAAQKHMKDSQMINGKRRELYKYQDILKTIKIYKNCRHTYLLWKNINIHKHDFSLEITFENNVHCFQQYNEYMTNKSFTSLNCAVCNQMTKLYKTP